jgi:hypothetical protein
MNAVTGNQDYQQARSSHKVMQLLLQAQAQLYNTAHAAQQGLVKQMLTQYWQSLLTLQ